MKDIILVIGTISIFILGYIAVKNLDFFVHSQIKAKNNPGKHRIKIAAEHHELLDFAASALEYGFNANSLAELQYIRGNTKRLLRKLSRGSVDVVLLSEKNNKLMGNKLSFVQIPYPDSHGDMSADPVNMVYVVWNRTIQSPERTRIVLILENEHFRLKHGYCDYLE